jgi:hypothetical protein
MAIDETGGLPAPLCASFGQRRHTLECLTTVGRRRPWDGGTCGQHRDFVSERRRIMPDDKTNRGPQDRVRVNLSEDYEVRYWTEKFDVSKAELEKAVAKAGQSAAAVARELGKTL